MTAQNMLRDFAAYNIWANTELVNWLIEQPDSLLEQETPSSFPTIRQTLLHIWDVESSWLEDLQGLPNAASLQEVFTGSTAELFAGLLGKSIEFEVYVQALSPAELEAPCTYPRYDGALETRMRFEIIQHCMNHSTYHRGQLVTMVRQLGLTDPPQTDYIKYLRVRAVDYSS
jgi:uncharacterized damage-inducible protein DinB